MRVREYASRFTYHKMNQQIKSIIKKTFLYDAIRLIKQRRRLYNWEKRGRPVPPPPLFKQRLVRAYARQFALNTLVETGTFNGQMVYASRHIFQRIFSIELDQQLYQQARKKFARFDHVVILLGDSGKVLPRILENIDQPCLFWLDAHAMVGGVRGPLITPIKQELEHIMSHAIANHVILIDDARLFAGRADYPTLNEVRDLLCNWQADSSFEVKDDVIRFHRGVHMNDGPPR
ncbi:MAG: hypothetical protein L0331_32030 [Chloroflexi bacterium]|nr:hypothetical protein [Chloroflexota bacterium]MCI0648194.1 hypothetical protein [Chloroflexota bacterium]